MKRARGVLVFVLVIVLLLSIPGATVFAHPIISDLSINYCATFGCIDPFKKYTLSLFIGY